MSAFLGGFAKSLADRMKEDRQRKQAMMDYEEKLRLTDKLNKEFGATTKSRTETYESSPGVFTSQDYDANNNPMGNPRAASPDEASKKKRELEALKEESDVRKANIRQSNASTARSEKETSQMDDELAMKREGLRYQGAYAADASARAEATRAALEAERSLREARTSIVERFKAGQPLTTDEWRMLEGREATSEGRVPAKATTISSDAAAKEYNEVLSLAESITADNPDMGEEVQDILAPLEGSASPEKVRAALTLLRSLKVGSRSFKSIINSINSRPNYEDELAKLRGGNAQ